MSSRRLTATVEGHTACSDQVMLLSTPFLNELLSCNITGSKEERGGYTLSKQWARSQPGVVPGYRSARTA